MNFLTSCLIKGNANRLVYFLCGSGGNGKSGLFNSLSSVLGTYFAAGGQDFLSKGNGFSDVVRENVGTSSVIGVDEPTSIIAEQIKAYSGNAKVRTRGMYQKQIELKTMAQIIVALNHPPVGNFDIAVLNRIVAFPFRASFVDSSLVAKSIKNQIQQNRFVKNELNDNSDVGIFSTILLNLVYNFTINKGCKEFTMPPAPPVVEYYTTQFQTKCDSFSAFSEFSSFTSKPNSKATIRQLDTIISKFTKLHKIENMKGEIKTRFVEMHKYLLACEDPELNRLGNETKCEHIIEDFDTLMRQKRKPRENNTLEIISGEIKIKKMKLSEEAPVTKTQYLNMFYFKNHEFCE